MDIFDIHSLWLEYHRLHDTPLRFGQFACNKLKIQNQALFYETDNRKAFDLLEAV
jgi:hypothetical protein